MKRLSVLIAITIGLFTFNPASAETIERIVAIVGSDIITLYDVERAMAPYYNEINKSPKKEIKYKEVRAETVSRLIDDLLLKQAIENAKIAVTNDDIARTIRDILSRNHITIDMLKEELANKGISYESYKDDLKRSIQRMKFINQEIGSMVRIPDQEMREYYTKHMDEFGVHRSVHIAQIVLPFDEATSKEKAIELKSKAAEISKEARSGSSFAALAKQYSKGPNAEGGGDLGIIDPANLLPEIVAALEKMKTGEISDPILSPAGIHIIQLIDRAKATESDFEKLKDQIYNKMYEQRVTEELNLYLAEQRKKTYVEIRE